MRVSACSFFLVIGLAAMGQGPAPDIEPSHEENDLYRSLIRDGMTLTGTHVAFPAPLLQDGDSPEAEKKVLRTIAGSENGAKELVRNSVTAPHILRVRDVKAADGTIIRLADVWFVVRGELSAFDPGQVAARKGAGKPVEAGNLRFVSKLLGDDELKKRGIERTNLLLEFYTHLTGDMLDRLHVESTDRERASRSPGSWAFASRTDPRFDDDAEYPNRWWPVVRAQDQGKDAPLKATGKPARFEGGASITKISQLVTVPGALLIESHFAFAEPFAWFKGEPILRSKFSPAAQSQIRDLRKKLAEAGPLPKS
jgi:hypothetical protein